MEVFVQIHGLIFINNRNYILSYHFPSVETVGQCIVSKQTEFLLTGSVVFTARRVLRLRMEETASRYGG
jgi:hypothetical protein